MVDYMECNLETKKKDFSRLGWALVISNIFGYISFYIYMKSLIYINYKDSIGTIVDINNLTANQISIGAILMILSRYFVLNIYNKRDGTKKINLIDRKGISIINILKIFIIASFFVMVGSYTALLIEKILLSFGITTSVSFEGLDEFSKTRIGLIYLGLIGPIFEELIYRGVILNKLKNYGMKFSIITSAIIFALSHGNFIQLLQTFFMGLILGYIFMKTNSLFLPMILHIMMNSFSLIIEFYLVDPNASRELLVTTSILIIFFIGTIYILYSSKGNILLGENITLIEKNQNIKHLENRVGRGNRNFNIEPSENIYLSFYFTIPIALMLLVYTYRIVSSVKVI